MKARITLLPGDGIGPEVLDEAVKTVKAIAAKYDHEFTFQEALIGGAAIDATGSPLPDDTVEKCSNCDGVLLAAVGDPKYDDPTLKVRPEQGLLGLRKPLHLPNRRNSAFLRRRDQVLSVPEGDHEGYGIMRQSPFDRGGIALSAPCYEAHADPLIARVLKRSLHPIRIAVSAADYAQAAGRGHSRGEFSPGDFIHWGQHDRMSKVEFASERRFDRHNFPSFVARKTPNRMTPIPMSRVISIGRRGTPNHPK